MIASSGLPQVPFPHPQFLFAIHSPRPVPPASGPRTIGHVEVRRTERMDGRGQMNEALAPALRRRTWRHGSNTLSYLHLRVCLGPQSAAWCGCCPDAKIRPYDAAGQAARPRSIRGRLNHLAMAACLGRERPPISCAQGSSRAHGVSERVGWQGRGRGSPCESRLVGLGKVQLEVSVDHLARSYQLQLRRREALRALQPTPECN